MSVGYVPGNGPLHRAHPFTPVTLAAVLAVLAFVLPAPFGPVALCIVAIALAMFERIPAILKPAILTSLPFWGFAFLIHGLIRGLPWVALGLATRITTVVVAFLTLLAVVEPARLVDALVERRLPFSFAYMFAATLQAVPRLRNRAREILDAQRCRGLSLGGSVFKRGRAIVPLALPLILTALAEVDERAFALEARGAAHVTRRTVLHPPMDHPRERAMRWGLLVVLAAAIVLRIVM